MAILDNDLVRLKELTKTFNIEEYFSIFACIVTGRSWEAIVEGIRKVKYSDAEVSRYEETILKMFQIS